MAGRGERGPWGGAIVAGSRRLLEAAKVTGGPGAGEEPEGEGDPGLRGGWGLRGPGPRWARW